MHFIGKQIVTRSKGVRSPSNSNETANVKHIGRARLLMASFGQLKKNQRTAL